MRTDREQFDLILNKKEEQDKKKRTFRKRLYSFCSVFVCFAVVLTAVLAWPSNNKEAADSGNKFAEEDVLLGADGVMNGGTGSKAETAPTYDSTVSKWYSATTDSEHYLGDLRGETATDDWYLEEAPAEEWVGAGGDGFKDSAFISGSEEFESVPELKPTGAGTLTAGETNDNKNFEAWLETLNENERYALVEKFGLLSNKRIAVSVVSGGAPVSNAKVRLMDADGKCIYSAVSDVYGNAYVFYGKSFMADAENLGGIEVYPANGGLTEVNFDIQEGQIPESLTVEVVYSDYPMISEEEQAKKLELLLMVDTTGSMGDELRYLQAELEDVVSRVAKFNEASVLTSVNFYRDEGDDYVVRDFPFRANVNEAVEELYAQESSGGGDYEEAVHTALENMINAHQWSDDAVKIAFLVLDAPAHDEAKIYDSIKNSVLDAAEKGIRIIPVISSGADMRCEMLCRSMAVLSGGTFAFLTDHSGVGGSHIEPDVEQYTVERLNDLMVRVVSYYLGNEYEAVPYNASVDDDYVQ